VLVDDVPALIVGGLTIAAAVALVVLVILASRH
jgi:hypothetical protein